MPLSLIRPGDRAVMLCYLGAPRLDRVPDGIAVVVSSETRSDVPASLVAARKLAGLPADAPIAVCGYSAGCQPVRALLMAAGPDAADAWVTIDGTADSYPTPTPSRVEAWRRLAAAARAGSVLWVATCIQQAYVERLRPPQGPYSSTRRVLEAATGLDLRGSMARAPSGVRPDGTLTGPPAVAELAHRYVEGGLVVESYASADTDAAEHRAQAQVVYPRLIEEVVAPWLLERRLPAAQTGKDAASPPGLLSLLGGAAARVLAPLRALGGHLLRPRPLTLGEALLEEALKDLGVKEVGGANRGPEVDAYNRGCGVPMGSPWCASSLTAWLRRAALRMKTKAPILGSAGAKRIMFELQKAGRWFTAAEIRANPALLRPGMIHCWDRDGEKGHVGVHKKVRDAQAFDTVEGNSGTGPFGEGNRVAEMVRRFDDPRWLGAGWVD